MLRPLLKNRAHRVGGVEDGLAQGWQRLCVQALWRAHGDHVAVGGDGAQQALEVVDLVQRETKDGGMRVHCVILCEAWRGTCALRAACAQRP
ncbi:hypothetical protein ASF73_19555 [Xanthomonas sp. Leaf131]|nr:hypothetical protein ASF73_19555 [Xanthomonas sp. Leaf131]